MEGKGNDVGAKEGQVSVNTLGRFLVGLAGS